uniref:Ig-like domain-containing protein n=1 Tax=Sinocyclocheilus grahami TaxID=75366 RepID=A0A672RNG6_SINGR
MHPSLWWSRLPSLCLMYFLFIRLIFSAEGNIHVFQKPRFVGVKTGQTVKIYCVPSSLSLPAHVEWFKGQSYKDQLKNSQKITITEKSDKLNASITIKKVEIEDRGTYFCKLNGMLGPGTELQVSSKCHFVNVIRLLSSPACCTISILLGTKLAHFLVYKSIL